MFDTKYASHSRAVCGLGRQRASVHFEQNITHSARGGVHNLHLQGGWSSTQHSSLERKSITKGGGNQRFRDVFSVISLQQCRVQQAQEGIYMLGERVRQGSNFHSNLMKFRGVAVMIVCNMFLPSTSGTQTIHAEMRKSFWTSCAQVPR